MPAMTLEQTVSWYALMDMHKTLPGSWTVVGGQMIHLHCAERDTFPMRATDDIDALLDVKARPTILLDFTAGLVKAGFAPDGISAEGHQHRWKNGEAQIDVLISNKLGERKVYETVTGATTVGTPVRHWS